MSPPGERRSRPGQPPKSSFPARTLPTRSSRSGWASTRSTATSKRTCSKIVDPPSAGTLKAPSGGSMRRLCLALLLCAAPAFAREVRGRVSHTEEGGEAVKKLAQGAYVLKANVVTEAGEVVSINVQEGLTKGFEGSRLTVTGAVRANARIKAVLDDECKLESDLCIATSVDIEQVAGLTRIEAVQERAALADAELDKGMESADPGMKALAGGHG